MTDNELRYAFKKLKREDLEHILSVLNNDAYISHTIKSEIDLIVKPENISKRLMDDGIEAINKIQNSTKKLEKEIGRYSFGINFQNNIFKNYVSLLTKTLDSFLPRFMELKMEKEGVRFICAIITIVDTSKSEEIVELGKRLNFSPYYKRLIESGKIGEENLLRFRDEYEDRSFITPIDIFSSENIKFMS